MSRSSAHHIVLGNEKGGTGKSTLAMHIVIGLMERGKQVAVIDLDGRQKTITRYLDNRQAYMGRHDIALTQPAYEAIPPSDLPDTKQQQQAEQTSLEDVLHRFQQHHDIIVLDCPGNDTWLSRLAHALADTLVTPVNDSFVDLDLLGNVDPDDYQIKKLSYYSEMVWSSRKLRAAGGKPPMDWIVVRNRIAGINSRNKQRVDNALSALQQRIMFRYIPGLHDRVIYRELFPRGLTFLDLKKIRDHEPVRLSHIATRYEVRELVSRLNLPD